MLKKAFDVFSKLQVKKESKIPFFFLSQTKIQKIIKLQESR